jgi:hypothetical protein
MKPPGSFISSLCLVGMSVGLVTAQDRTGFVTIATPFAGGLSSVNPASLPQFCI